MESRFYALILKTQESHTKYWICYQLSEKLEDIMDISCYRSETLALPKEEYEGHLVKDLIDVPSCRTGNKSEFAIYGFSNSISQLTQFNFALK